MEYYVPILKEKFDDYPRRQKELEQLILMASRYKKLGSFLDDLVLDPPTSSADINLEENRKTLTLSTVHSAKGLEWPVVFLIWVMEGRFPPSRAYNNPLVLEEERRLMYVAATRAQDQLIMCYPGQESLPLWQQGEGVYRNGLSSFIRGLPTDVVSHESPGVPTRFSARKRYERSAFHNQQGQRESQGLSQGDRVRHPAFGPGVVSKLIADDKVEVLFRNAGRKLLHLEYTTLEKV
jgi:DNA helicase-2/ATP-dependent DNA helicase PcrA